VNPFSIMGRIKNNLISKATKKEASPPRDEVPPEDDDPIANAWKKGTKTANFTNLDKKDDDNEVGSGFSIMGNLKAKMLSKPPAPKPAVKTEPDLDESNEGSGMLMSRIKKNVEAKAPPKEEPKQPPKEEEDDDPIARAMKKGERTADLKKLDEEDNEGSGIFMMKKIQSGLTKKGPTPLTKPSAPPQEDDDDPIAKAMKKGERTADLKKLDEENNEGSGIFMMKKI
jgi:hypothetical protein